MIQAAGTSPSNASADGPISAEPDSCRDNPRSDPRRRRRWLREIVSDGGFQAGPTKDAFPDLTGEQIQLSGHHEPGSRRTRKRRARYRTGIEGRISHLKRGYGLRRTRLKGDDGMRTWTGWAILAYDLDTLAIRAG